MKLSSAVCLIDGRKAAEVEHRQVPLWSQKVRYNTIKRYECCSTWWGKTQNRFPPICWCFNGISWVGRSSTLMLNFKKAAKWSVVDSFLKEPPSATEEERVVEREGGREDKLKRKAEPPDGPAPRRCVPVSPQGVGKRRRCTPWNIHQSCLC